MAPRGRTREKSAGAETKNGTTSSYGTRASKRKAEDPLEEVEQESDSQPTKRAVRSTSKKVAPQSPVLKKRKTSSRAPPPQQQISSHSSTEDASPLSTEPTPAPMPEIAIEGPQEESGEQSSAPSPVKAWSEPPVLDGSLLPTPIPHSPRNNLRGRGGFRGRGRGRGFKAASGRATPVPSQPAEGITKTGRGGGRGRVKKHPTARLCAVNWRKEELRNAYKTIAAFLQQDILPLIAEKSLAKSKDDAAYYKSLPEYAEVMTNLDTRLAERKKEIDTLEKLDLDLYQRKIEYDAYYENHVYKNRVDVIVEKYLTLIQERSVYIKTQREKGLDVDEINYSKGEKRKNVKTIAAPEMIVHPFAVPLFKETWAPMHLNKNKMSDIYEQDPSQHSAIGDTPYEQHPANFWLSLSHKGKQSLTQMNEVRARDLAIWVKEKKKKKTKDSLFSTNHAAAYIEEDGNDEEPEPEEVVATVNAGVADVDDPYENAAAQSEDEHGFQVPRKRAYGNGEPPSNRIVGPSYIQYDDDEIGQRVHVLKRINREWVDIGTDANPTPKKLHYNQVASHHNSARSVPEDFFDVMVEQHGLHPRFGLPMTGSANPDHDEIESPYFKPPTNWTKPLPGSRPVTIVEKSRNGTRKVFQTSTSEWIHTTEEDFEEAASKCHMQKLLQQWGYFADQNPDGQQPEVIDPMLVQAAEDARLEDEREAAMPKATVAPLQLPIPTPPQPQRTQQYDPVRDSAGSSGYDSPYARPAPNRTSRPQPYSHPPGRIGELADTALNDAIPRVAMPPPPPPPPPPPHYQPPPPRSFERPHIPFSQPQPPYPGQGTMHLNYPPPLMPSMYQSSAQRQQFSSGPVPGTSVFQGHPFGAQQHHFQQQQGRPGPQPAAAGNSGLRSIQPAPPRNQSGASASSPSRSQQWRPYAPPGQ